MITNLISKGVKSALFLICFVFLVQETKSNTKTSEKLLATAKYYHLDSKTGNDKNNGLTPKTAWKSLAKLNAVKLSAGDRVLFKRDGVWNGQLRPRGSGLPNKPIQIAAYGKGKKPLIAGNGISNGTIFLFNQQYWEINDLEVTNYNAAEEGGISLATWEKNNETNYVEKVLPPQLTNKNKPKYGILIAAEDIGEVKHIQLKNLKVHGVNGYIDQQDEESKNNGGVVFKITGKLVPTFFNGILIDSCQISDVDRTGLFFTSTWSNRTLTKNINWIPSLDVRISNNLFSTSGANALIMRVSHKAIIEKNLFDRCAIKGSGNAAFSFNTDSTIWQYNECRFTKANIDDRDAGGIDSDFKSKFTIIQYNYIHNNDYGLLITGGPNSFNYGTILRYNIIESDGKYAHPKHGKGVIRVSGSATNTHIYNNVIVLDSAQFDTGIVSHEVWRTTPSETFYSNNIFYNWSKNSFFDLEKSSNNNFNGNLYFGKPTLNMPEDKNAILTNPAFVNPLKGIPAGYKLKQGSPAISTGQLIKGNGSFDFFNNPLPESTKLNVGAYNGASL